ncbi:molybdopterin-dependent oxidoreductase [Arabiibacter massiliensis]|uniref:molybdopterin-dependent oxidoreductase n=1 Tax=Arabiibacter massiliensis TaxID=1870985 RepID=UPI00155A64CA|nr:molybdopterin-dependent oxidoreductase [Arabiibacter massiliensis]
MSTLKKTLVVGTSSVLALAGVGGGVALAIDASGQQGSQQAASQEAGTAYAKTDVVTMDVVEGEFAFTQAEASSNEELKAALGAAKYLCGARPTGVAPAIAAEDWEVSVVGAVANPYAATFSELAATDEVQSVLMGCACAGNPADGKASANAEVTGISVLAMIGMAQPAEGANTVVFTSADGYEVALPLSYLERRYCPLVFDINGAPLAESVGGVNQLWLGATSANYFARDVAVITLEERETPPPAPNSEEARSAYANLPNVGVLLGGEVA